VVGRGEVVPGGNFLIGNGGLGTGGERRCIGLKQPWCERARTGAPPDCEPDGDRTGVGCECDLISTSARDGLRGLPCCCRAVAMRCSDGGVIGDAACGCVSPLCPRPSSAPVTRTLSDGGGGKGTVEGEGAVAGNVAEVLCPAVSASGLAAHSLRERAFAFGRGLSSHANETWAGVSAHAAAVSG
jgi:hypothetical protein